VTPADRDEQERNARLRAELPWLVNGTLDEATSRELAALARHDLATRRELLETRALAAFVAAEDTFAPDIARQVERIRARATGPVPVARAVRITRIAAAVLLPVLVLAGLALYRATTPTFETLSAPAPAAPADARVRLRLQLATPVAREELSAVLRPFDAELVEGPRAEGLYTVALPPAQEAAARQELARRYAPLHLDRANN